MIHFTLGEEDTDISFLKWGYQWYSWFKKWWSWFLFSNCKRKEKWHWYMMVMNPHKIIYRFDVVEIWYGDRRKSGVYNLVINLSKMVIKFSILLETILTSPLCGLECPKHIHIIFIENFMMIMCAFGFSTIWLNSSLFWLTFSSNIFYPFYSLLYLISCCVAFQKLCLLCINPKGIQSLYS